MNFQRSSYLVMFIAAAALALASSTASADDDGFEAAPASPGPKLAPRSIVHGPAPREEQIPEPDVVPPPVTATPYVHSTPSATVGQRYLTEAEIRSMIFGHTISGSNGTTIKYNNYIDSAGHMTRLFYNYEQARYGRDAAQVSVENGLYCVERRLEKRCGKLIFDGKTMFFANRAGERGRGYFTVIATGNAVGDALK